MKTSPDKAPGAGAAVAVVGAGLGGLSAAITLAQQGYAVRVFEKNAHAGGKLNVLEKDGFTFDLGPSILTLPHIFKRLFERSNRRMEDYLALRALRPHWRNFFEDGTKIDLYPEPDRMAEELTKLGESPGNFQAFLDYSARLYDLVDEGYFEKGLDGLRDFQRHYGLARFLKFDLLRTMHGGVSRFVRHPRLRDVMDFFIKYVGSSAYDAPAFMNCLPTIQYRYDLWYVEGGMIRLAQALHKLAEEIGVEFRFGCEVAGLRAARRTVEGLELRDGSFHAADIVVSNMEVVPAYEKLLGKPRSFLKTLRALEPACSGLVLDLGLDRTYSQLAHHNFFFSGNQKEHFHTVFRKRAIPRDPTLYVVAAARTNADVAPPGCDNLKILPHIPCLDDANPTPPEAYRALRDRVLVKLERMGLHDLRKHIVVEHMWTPYDIREQYYSNRGSIYGVVADRWRNFGFKAPKQSSAYDNLFFVGGSVNPGGGMPMVTLCGQNVGKLIAQKQGKR
jgi:diapolycopene oxygenase